MRVGAGAATWATLLAAACGRVGFTGSGSTSDAAPDAASDAASDAVVALDAPTIDAPPSVVGCADETREDYADLGAFPGLAACAGGWSIAGLRDPVPTCGRGSGDDSANPAGVGCSAEDLCGVGWHVCRTFAEVGLHIDAGTCSAALASAAGVFYATQQSGPGGDECQPTGTNDLFGCGSGFAFTVGCGPLDVTSNDFCSALTTDWDCGGGDGSAELLNVVKTSAAGGGVVCCVGP